MTNVDNADCAWEIFQQHKTNAEQFLSNIGNSPVARNAAITNVYGALAEKDPTFLWLSLGSLVSGTVGKNIHATGLAPGFINASSTLYNALPGGNQTIFKDIIPLYLTYQTVGYSGVQAIQKSKYSDDFGTKELYDAFKSHHTLQETQAKIARDMGLDKNDPKVIEALFSIPENIELGKKTLINFGFNEQTVVQPLYTDEVTHILTNELLGALGDQAFLGGVKINDQYYAMLHYIDDPSDFNQRMEFVKILGNAVANAAGNAELFSQYMSEAANSASCSLWATNPYSGRALDGITGVYWGGKADKFDESFIAAIHDFLDIAQDIPKDIKSTKPPSENSDVENVSFISDTDNLKIDINLSEKQLDILHPSPKSLDEYPHYFTSYDQQGNTYYYNGALPWFPNDSSYFYKNQHGLYFSFNPWGETRGLPFPVLIESKTQTPLTTPLIEGQPVKQTTDSISLLFNEPEVFTQHSSTAFDNYSHNMKALAQQNAIFGFGQGMMNGIDAQAKQFTLGLKDVLSAGNNFNLQINGQSLSLEKGLDAALSKLKNAGELAHGYETESPGQVRIVISSITLANGTTYDLTDSGRYECVNCSILNNGFDSAVNDFINGVNI